MATRARPSRWRFTRWGLASILLIVTALARVLRENPDLSSEPGHTYRYGNIGYWLLGEIVEQTTGRSYAEYMRENVLTPLGLTRREIDFTIAEPAIHANGYLARYSFLNLAKGLVMDREFWGGYEGDWLRFERHHLDGPAFGGMIGTARGFSRFLQDQLRPTSVLLGSDAKRMLGARQVNAAGEPIPMMLGWHVGETDGVVYLFKEGGGGGFHSEMRLYPTRGIGTVVIVNATEFDTRRFLNRLDRWFM